MILFWLIPILLLVYVFRGQLPGNREEKKQSPEDILKERYARGEIDKEEFDRTMKDLRS